MSNVSSPLPLPAGAVWVQSFGASRVQAGFPSPAEDHQVERIDLLRELVRHPQATFMLRVRGNSMRDAGIFDGTVVLVDKAVRPKHGHVVIAVVDGEFTCKRLGMRGGRMALHAANPAFADWHPSEGQTLEVWGVVVACIHQFPL